MIEWIKNTLEVSVLLLFFEKMCFCEKWMRLMMKKKKELSVLLETKMKDSCVKSKTPSNDVFSRYHYPHEKHDSGNISNISISQWHFLTIHT
jgi:hypothetical protein